MHGKPPDFYVTNGERNNNNKKVYLTKNIFLKHVHKVRFQPQAYLVLFWVSNDV